MVILVVKVSLFTMVGLTSRILVVRGTSFGIGAEEHTQKMKIKKTQYLKKKYISIFWRNAVFVTLNFANLVLEAVF